MQISFKSRYLIMGQHVQSLPVSFDLSGDVLILQDHALSSTLTPLCREKKRKTPKLLHLHSTTPSIFIAFILCVSSSRLSHLSCHTCGK